MIKKIKIICLISVIASILVSGLYIVNADEIINLNKVQQLLDYVTNAAYSTEEIKGEVYIGGSLSDAFVQKFLNVSAQFENDNKLISDSKHQNEYLKSIFNNEISTKVNVNEKLDSKYIGFKFMTGKKIDDNNFLIIGSIYIAPKEIEKLTTEELGSVQWLDRRILIGLNNSISSKYGYKVSEYSLHGELQLEEELDKYFSNLLIEYINTKFGFSLQYPAIFNEKSIVENDNSISAKTDDDSANFFVKCFSNSNKMNVEQFKKLSEDNKIQIIDINPNKNSISTIKVDINNRIIYDLYLFRETTVYQVEYSFNKSLVKDFGMYIQYLKNTFSILDNTKG